MQRHRSLRRFILAAWIAAALGSSPVCPAAAAPAGAAPPAQNEKLVFTERKDLFDKMSAVTGIPWYDLAAVDQYERTLALANKRPRRNGMIAITFPELKWVGMLNPDYEDTNPGSIAFFGGVGKDGDGDGKADRNNDVDLLYSMAARLLKSGVSEEDFRIALWEHYQNTRSVDRIVQFAKIYAAFGRLDLHQHTFVLPLNAEYSYRDTWGANRGWGGFRIHEGTDLFASYGVPVRSACYGIVEVKGWNRYGGWRLGIRDLNNVYHYYAHLSGFQKELKEGDIVTPGQVIGRVGSSGYGKPGTSGKFPPHLHYGLYRDNGLTEWSFDPYSYLRRWEREERLRSRKK